MFGAHEARHIPVYATKAVTDSIWSVNPLWGLLVFFLVSATLQRRWYGRGPEGCEFKPRSIPCRQACIADATPELTLPNALLVAATMTYQIAVADALAASSVCLHSKAHWAGIRRL